MEVGGRGKRLTMHPPRLEPILRHLHVRDLRPEPLRRPGFLFAPAGEGPVVEELVAVVSNMSIFGRFGSVLVSGECWGGGVE